MPQISSVRVGHAIMHNGQACTVIGMNFVNPGKGAAFYSVKLKNLKTGNVIETNIKSGSSIEEADVGYYKAQYLYNDGTDYYFMDVNSFEQFALSSDILGSQVGYLQEQVEYKVMYLDGIAVGIELPPKVELKIIQAAPGVKGNTAANATKDAVLETGITIRVPLFIKEGDIVRINTSTGEYTERAN